MQSVTTLRAFGVPFVLYTRDIRCKYVSESARRLLAGHADGLDPTLSRVSRFVEQALTELRTSSNGASQIGGIARGVDVSIHIQRVDGVPAEAIVVFHPSPMTIAPEARLDSYGLTRRELEVARLIANGHSGKQVAAALRISPHTARHHTESVFSKLGVQCRGQVMLMFAGVGSLAGA
jgi:DNA-binding CsgD family transcriptional regulator